MKFEIGKTYSTRFACDYDSVISFKVVARTAKMITLESDTWGQVKRGVRIDDGVEICSPLGRYSMSPTLHADHPGEIY